MWADRKFRALSAPPPNGRTLWMYLLCGPRTCALPGLVVASEGVIAADLGWTLEGFRDAFAEVSAQGMAKADWKAGLVVLPRALMTSSGPRDTSRPESPNVLKHWLTLWHEIPECDLKDQYRQWLKTFADALGQGFAKAFHEAFAKAGPPPSPNQEQEQRTGTGEKKDLVPPPAPPDEVTNEEPDILGKLEFPSKQTKTEARASKIPERAWAAADWLRNAVLGKQPNNPISKQPWGSDVKHGTRLAWAGVFKLLHERDGVPWEEIAKACSWVMGDQGREEQFRIQVLSPSALREKWGRIQQGRQTQTRGPSRPSSNVFTDLDEAAEELKKARGVA